LFKFFLTRPKEGKGGKKKKDAREREKGGKAFAKSTTKSGHERVFHLPREHTAICNKGKIGRGEKGKEGGGRVRGVYMKRRKKGRNLRKKKKKGGREQHGGPPQVSLPVEKTCYERGKEVRRGRQKKRVKNETLGALANAPATSLLSFFNELHCIQGRMGGGKGGTRGRGEGKKTATAMEQWKGRGCWERGQKEGREREGPS